MNESSAVLRGVSGGGEKKGQDQVNCSNTANSDLVIAKNVKFLKIFSKAGEQAMFFWTERYGFGLIGVESPCGKVLRQIQEIGDGNKRLRRLR